MGGIIMIKVTLTKNNGTDIISLDGELNIETTATFEKKFPEIVSNNIILDMSKLKYISSAGLRSLVILYEKVNKVNGKIILARANSLVKEIIEVSGFEVLFRIFNTLDEATKYLSS